MTTYEYGRSLLTEARRSPRARALVSSVVNGWRKLRPVVGSVAGLSCLVGAAFTYTITAGLIAAGVACFVAEWRVRG